MDSEQDIKQDPVVEELYRQLKEGDADAFPPSVGKSGIGGGE
jgi:hypothetical protein